MEPFNCNKDKTRCILCCLDCNNIVHQKTRLLNFVPSVKNKLLDKWVHAIRRDDRNKVEFAATTSCKPITNIILRLNTYEKMLFCQCLSSCPILRRHLSQNEEYSRWLIHLLDNWILLFPKSHHRHHKRFWVHHLKTKWSVKMPI